MKPPEDVKREFVQRWLAKAESDLLASRHLLQGRPDLAGTAAFHAQQAVEKALKALLVWHQIEFSKTHDIDRLLELVAQVEQGLAKRVEKAGSLTAYAVEYRYPTELPQPTAAQAEEALRIAQKVRDEVIACLPSEFQVGRS
jgi:HEPN domain-containing protein